MWTGLFLFALVTFVVLNIAALLIEAGGRREIAPDRSGAPQRSRSRNPEARRLNLPGFLSRAFGAPRNDSMSYG